MGGRHVGFDFYDLLIEVLYRKRTARQARHFGLAFTSEFAFETALTSPARNVVCGSAS